MSDNPNEICPGCGKRAKFWMCKIEREMTLFFEHFGIYVHGKDWHKNET